MLIHLRKYRVVVRVSPSNKSGDSCLSNQSQNHFIGWGFKLMLSFWFASYVQIFDWLWPTVDRQPLASKNENLEGSYVDFLVG